MTRGISRHRARRMTLRERAVERCRRAAAAWNLACTAWSILVGLAVAVFLAWCLRGGP